MDSNNVNSQEDKPIKRVLYVIVMEEESSEVLEKEAFTKDQILEKEYGNILEGFNLEKKIGNDILNIHIIRPTKDPLSNTGLFGTEIAFFLTYIGVKHYKPDIVFSMGYAGDTSKIETEGDSCNQQTSKLSCGTVVIAKDKGIYHRREMIIKFFENTSHGHYPLLNCHNLVKDLNFIHANVGTSNSFVKHDNIAFEKNIQVVEMELCSVARACHYFSVPCIGVKIISDSGSDNVDEKEREKQFLESLIILKKKFHESFGNINNYLTGKTISQL
jgi:hypothetical protein